MAEGNGPVNALDQALRKDLGRYQSHIEDVELVDYKVRILTGGTEAVTRVLVESRDKGTGERWFTVGVSPNIVDASFEALIDSITYKLLRPGWRGGPWRELAAITRQRIVRARCASCCRACSRMPCRADASSGFGSCVRPDVNQPCGRRAAGRRRPDSTSSAAEPSEGPGGVAPLIALGDRDRRRPAARAIR